MKQPSIYLALTIPGRGGTKPVQCEVTKRAARLVGTNSVADILLCTEKPRIVLPVEEVIGKKEYVGFSTLRQKAQEIDAFPAFPGKWFEKRERIICLADSFPYDDCRALEALVLLSSNRRVFLDAIVVQRVGGNGKICDTRLFPPDQLVML